MKTLIAIFCLCLPVWLMAGQAGAQNSPPKEYKVWLLDERGKLMHAGMYRAHTDSSITLLVERRPSFLYPDFETTILLKDIHTIQYRDWKESNRKGNLAAQLSGLGFWIIASTISSTTDLADTYFPRLVGGVLIGTVVSLIFGLPFMFIIKAFSTFRQPSKDPMIPRKDGHFDFSALEH
ncbi:MAG: hypothetical protein AAFQ87_02940 [Bacteroidota bacterium]